MKSMTGYGKGEATLSNRTITIEIKSVNNRYLDINTRIPKSLAFCDDVVKREIQKVIKRGNVDVFFNYDNKSEDSKAVNIDIALAREYYKASKTIRTEFALEHDFNTTALMRSPEVLKLEFAKDDPELVLKLVKKGVVMAVGEIDKMRKVEGESIKDDFTKIISKIVKLLESITKRAPKALLEHREKIVVRIADVLQGVEIDQARLLNEVAFYSDKSDINEEISRLSSHISQFITALESNDAVGRKLDFISQEMNREINTIGSKSNDIAMSNDVIALKNELEKIKEQIRNVE